MWSKFKGTGVAIVTPFHDDGGVDFNALGQLIEHLISNDINYLVVQGTTGESVTLSQDEKNAVLDYVLETNNKRLPVVLGIGGNNTQAVVGNIGTFNLEGVDAILSVSPYYNKPTQEGIYRHYKAIATETELPVILYNVPGRTASNITAETTLRLAHDFDNIIAVKEASGDLSQTGRIIKERPDGFLVVSGDDALTLPMISIGGDGVISVVANAFPKQFSALVSSALSGDFSSARSIHLRLMDVIELLFAEGNPAGVKAALKILGICNDTLRLPLVNISEATYAKLQKAVATLQPATKEV